MKKLKIFKSPWHTAHDHDLMMALKGVATFYLLTNYVRRWDIRNRPLPPNTRWVNYFEKGKYDCAILNVDQQCANYDLNKAVLMKHMREAIRQAEPTLPVIWINHATPVYPENYPDGNAKTEYKSEVLRKEILDIVGDDFMIVNSNQAAKEWKKGHTIWHGMEAKEWKCFKDKEPRACCFVSKAGIGDKYYNRSYLQAIKEVLMDRHAIRLHWINNPAGNFVAQNVDEYKEFLGKSLVYFNPTFASPMPRSRTEAMLSGCCIVTTPQHDAEMFIENGKNGFIVPHNNVDKVVAVIARLIKKDYKAAKIAGQLGRKTALKLFSRERYRKDWIELLKQLKIMK